MVKENYANPLGNQVLSLPKLVDEQVDICFSEEKMQAVLSMAEAFDIRKIYITGCGDSIAAAGAVAPVMHRFTGVFGCEAIEAMDFSRYLRASDIGIGEPNSPLVIGISAGGGTARVAEVLQKANEIGAFTIGITNQPDSLVARTAKRAFVTDTPKMTNDFPGLRSYFAGLIALTAIAVRIGRVKNILPPDSEKQIADAIKAYVHECGKQLEKIDEQMFSLAQTWKKYERYDFIGDGVELYSALFGLEKFVECCGVHANHDDSEDWCHIDYHIKNPETIGTIMFIDDTAPGYGRELETAKAACAIGRPVLIITNAENGEFPKDAEVVRLPHAKKGYEWLMPFMDFAPAAILAGYCCTLSGRKFFNEYDPIANAYNGTGVFFNRDNMTMKNSEIVIVK